MKKHLFFSACLLFIASSIHAETLFGDGIITIGTNETVIIKDVSASITPPTFYIDQSSAYYGLINSPDICYAITGPHTISVTNDGREFITFQRITNSVIQSIVISANQTETISVPAGKTIQFFDVLGNVTASAEPSDSTNTYNINLNSAGVHPSITGPATISVTANFPSSIVSFYFTDQIVQLPQQGFLNIPSPLLEVDVQKSYDLVNWTTTAAFHTDAEAGAFYRLKMLQ